MGSFKIKKPNRLGELGNMTGEAGKADSKSYTGLLSNVTITKMREGKPRES